MDEWIELRRKIRNQKVPLRQLGHEARPFDDKRTTNPYVIQKNLR
jgi:hypothetical protein